MKPFIYVCLFSIILLSNSIAQIHLSGSLSGVLTDTTYIADSTLIVEENDSLIVEPGAEIFFAGDYAFKIYGYLYAVGTEDDSIVLAQDTSAVGTWDGINFYSSSSDSNVLQYCQISGSNSSGIDCWGCGPRIENCSIFDNQAGDFGGGIYCNSTSSTTLVSCDIYNNTGHHGGGVEFASADNTAIDCHIHNNFCTGYGGGISVHDEAYFLNCIIEDNVVDAELQSAFAGGVFCNTSDAVFENCIIRNNTAGINSPGMGGGIFCTYSNPQFIDCIIDSNSAGGDFGGDGGGIACWESDAILVRCQITRNTSPASGGGTFIEFSAVDFQNCTISHNRAITNGAGILSNNSDFTLLNSVVSFNEGNGGIYFIGDEVSNTAYNDVFANGGANFAGIIPPGLGNLVICNANGDSCDIYHNIFLNPEFYAVIGDSAFYLNERSPCIDAGDPVTPLDPDSTIADIGAYYLDQNLLLPSITLTPTLPWIVIPPAGGSFNYYTWIINLSQQPLALDAWINIMFPDGNMRVGILSRTVHLEGNDSLFRTMSQSVPASAPAGNYTYIGYIGEFGQGIVDSSFFTFSKTE
jgi:hypothetical protein